MNLYKEKHMYVRLSVVKQNIKKRYKKLRKNYNCIPILCYNTMYTILYSTFDTRSKQNN